MKKSDIERFDYHVSSIYVVTSRLSEIEITLLHRDVRVALDSIKMRRIVVAAAIDRFHTTN